MIKRLIPSFLVILSGMILLGDIFIDHYQIEFDNLYGYNSTSNFVYWLSMMVSQVILIIASQFRPYRISYLSPLYILFLNMYWIFISDDYNDKSYFNIGVLGISFAILVAVSLITMIINKEKQEAIATSSRMELLERVFDLTVLKIKKKQ
ncbi:MULTISPECIES: hypothetical protein [Flavobacterium]|uniref:Uncharacterized protein n=1 Tax=Flavobacterium jumunjinense TaxID=998845 RepID=A0ABV5GUF5_9FLAO|nr:MULTISPECIES: hypothetical protein [Flavobacterium]